MRHFLFSAAVVALVCACSDGPGPGEFSIVTEALPNGKVGAPYRATIDATGGPADSWTVSDGDLPVGLALDGEGSAATVAGTPSSDGDYAFTVVATSGDKEARRSYEISISQAPLLIISTASASLTLGDRLRHTLRIEGGTSPYRWSLLGDEQPAEVALSAESGPQVELIGEFAESSVHAVGVRVEDAAGADASAEVRVVVARSGALAASLLPTWVTRAGQPFEQGLTASGGVGRYRWSLSDGALPPGIELVQSTLVGRSVAAGVYPFETEVEDEDGTKVAAAATIEVVDQLSISRQALEPTTVGESYAFDLKALGAIGEPQWAVSTGALPRGLHFEVADGSLHIGGTPTRQETAAIIFRVSDDSGQSALRSLSFRVYSALEIEADISVPVVTENTPLSFSVVANGGREPINWALSASAGQFSVSGGRVVQVTGQAPAGQVTIVLDATDADGRTHSRSVVGTVIGSSHAPLAVDTSSVPPATFDEPYSYQVGVSGGVGNVAVTLTGGALPDGLFLSGSGRTAMITGTPIAVGSFPEGVYQAQITATDDAGQSVTELLSIDTRYYLFLYHNGIFPLYQDESTHVPLQVLGGHPPYVITIPASSRPLTVAQSPYYDPDEYYYWYNVAVPASPDWDLSFTAMATDVDGRTETFALNLDVEPPEILLSAVPFATVDAPYAAIFETQGGVAPLSWSVVGGAGGLPPGLSLVPGAAGTAQIVGTPTQVGTYAVVIQAEDPRLLTNQQEISLTVFPPATMQVDLPGATIEVHYSTPIAVVGASPYTWSVTSGSLPSGLSIAPTPTGGQLSGTPTALFSGVVELTVTDTNGVPSSAFVELYVGPELVPLRPARDMRVQLRPNFVWSSSSTTSNHLVSAQVFSDADAQNQVTQQILSSGSEELVVDLPIGTYYWRLSSRHVLGSISNYSEPTRFKVQAHPVSPRNRWDGNGDGYPDVAVFRPNTYLILYGGPNGLSLQNATTLFAPTGYTFGEHYVEADLNDDGFGDLAMNTCSAVGCGAAVYRGSPSGIETVPTTIALGPLLPTQSLHSGGDISGDGAADLLLSTSPGDAWILTATTAGVITPFDFVNFPVGCTTTGERPQGVGDINGDGFDDIVCFDPSADEARFFKATESASGCDALFNNCNPRPSSILVQNVLNSIYSPSLPTYRTAIGDFDGDGIDDLAVCAPELWGDVAAIRGGPSPRVRFGQCTDEIRYWGLKVAAGDLNGDSFDDLVYDGWVAYGSPQFIQHPPTDLVRGLPLTIRDFDNNGFEDLLVQSAPGIIVYEGGLNGVGGQPGHADPEDLCPYGPGFGWTVQPVFATPTSTIVLP